MSAHETLSREDRERAPGPAPGAPPAPGGADDRYRRAFAHSSEGIWWIDLERPLRTDTPDDEQLEHFFRHACLTECNDAMARMYGYARADELVGARLGDLLVRENPDNVEYLKAFIRSGYRLDDAESIEVDRDGRPRYFLNSLAGVIEDGLLRGAWGTQRDITGRKEVEEALRRQNEQLRALSLERQRAEAALRFLADAGAALATSLDYETTLQEVAGLAVPFLAPRCSIDLVQPDGSLRRVAVAQVESDTAWALERLRDFPPDPQSPHPVAEVIRTGRPQVASEVTEADIDTFADTPEHRKLVEVLAPVSHMIVPLIARDRTLGTLLFGSSDPNRRFSAADLPLAEELAHRCALAIDNARLYREAQEAVRARDEFLSIASHELRTPVTTIKGAVQLLLRFEARGRLSSEELRRMLRRINRTSDHLTAMIADLLDVSRLQAGRLPLRLDRLDLTALIHEVAGRFEEQLERSHRLLIESSPDPCAVEADAARLEQVLANLLDNAVKYSPDGGEIRVRVGHDGAGVLVEVRDCGIGLPPGSEQQLFQPFGRAPNAAERQIPGLGLGLYICRMILERHGGRIRAASDGDGRGTTVAFWLPCAGDGQ